MGKEKNQSKMSFKEAVNSTPDVSSCYQEGLTAFGKYADKIKVPSQEKIGGSLDIDSATAKRYPDAARWDYALSYDDEVFYIEIHPAITSEVAKMAKKLQWLKKWLTTDAPEINKLTTKTKQPYYWIQSSNCNIPKHTPQYRTIVQNKILPMPVWDYGKICKK